MHRNQNRTTNQNLRNACGAIVENLEGRRLLAGVYELGININDGWSDTMRKGVPVMKDLGVKTTRVWVGPDFGNPKWEGALTRAVDLHNKGFDVMLIVNPEGGRMPAASDVKKWFTWAVGNSSLRNAVDRWQVGNEVDRSEYWRGNDKQYVNNFLKPAYEALHARGEKVVSGSVSWNPDDVKNLINEGMLNYADMVGYHPYADSISQLKTRVQQIKNIVGGRKPIVASEWNIRKLEHNKTLWSAAVKEAFPIVRDNFAYNYYFALLNTTRGNAGPAGIMNSNGSRQTLFYNALKAGMNGGGGSGSVDSGSGDNSGSGNSSSALPSVAKISVYSENGAKILDSLTSGSTIDLSKYDTNELRFIATIGSGTSSVKFTIGSKSITENLAPFEWGKFGASAGSYTLQVTPYSKDNLSGTKGSPRSFSFKVINSPGSSNSNGNTSSALPSVAKISVYSYSSGAKIIDSLSDGDIIDLSKFSGNDLRFLATIGSGTSSVKFTIGSKSITENLDPFEWGRFDASAGSYTLTVTPYSKDHLSGTKGATRTFSFKVVNNASQNGSSSNSSSSGTGSISGFIWNDGDSDGYVDSNENRTGQRQVFLDDNRNGRLDSGEKYTWSDSNGNYRFDDLAAGNYAISRVFPSGYLLSNDARGYITTNVTSGKTSGGNNLGAIRRSSPFYKAPTTSGGSSGNSSNASQSGSISGFLFNDSDKDGYADASENRTGVRTVFLDDNRNGRLDHGERSTRSNARGEYSFSNVSVGTHYVSRVFPSGFKMSNNSSGYISTSVSSGSNVSGVNIGSTYK